MVLTPQFIQRGLQVSLVRHDVVPPGCAHAGMLRSQQWRRRLMRPFVRQDVLVVTELRLFADYFQIHVFDEGSETDFGDLWTSQT